MHRTLILNLTLAMVAALLYAPVTVLALEIAPSPEPSPLPSPVAWVPTPICIDGVIPMDTGCKVNELAFAYPNVYGGREKLGLGVGEECVLASPNSTQSQLPEGYYSGKKVCWSAPDLFPGNIKAGTSVLGVNGIHPAEPPAPCPSPILPILSGIDTMCKSDVAGRYIYSTEYGGRKTVCTNSGEISADGNLYNTITGPCWLDQTNPPPTDIRSPFFGKSIATLRTEKSTAECPIGPGGVVSSTCKILQNKYWYTEPYGGRSLNCVSGTNSQSCWINSPIATVGTSNYCGLGYNGSVCETQTIYPSLYVYSQPYGGRYIDCSDDLRGYCYFTGATKQSTSPNFAPDNIRMGYSLFGIQGTFVGAEITWGSGAHRSKSASVNRITSKEESMIPALTSLNTAYPTYHSIPKIASDSDGYARFSHVTPVDRSTWGLNTCGTSGTQSVRISHCAAIFGANAIWDGRAKGNAGQGIWNLVTRTYASSKGYEVWKDAQTGLLWSSLVTSGSNWCQASGSNNSANTSIPTSKKGSDISGICNSSLYQITSASAALSACYEGSGFTTSGVNRYDSDGKVGLNSGLASTNGRVQWRLPSSYDYMLANHHGLRFVLPDISLVTPDKEEWTATVSAENPANAWTFNQSRGIRQVRSRTAMFSARCIGR